MGGEMNKKQIQLKKKAKEAKEAASKGKKSDPIAKKKAEKDRNAVQCSVCRQSFTITTKRPQLQDHIDSKHKKLGKTFEECFVGFVD